MAVALPLTMQQSIQRNTFLGEKKRLLGFIRHRVANAEEAEDILQEVFLQFVSAFESIESLDRVTAWLYRVARNKIIDRYRSRAAHPQHTALDAMEGADDEGPLSLREILPDLGNTPEAALLRDAIWEEVMLALDALPEEQRAVFVWNEMQERSFREIADETGVPLNTLLSRKRYAVLALRRRLQQFYNDLISD
jgi:RNA polymerase sigma factor (sigma-70 family)